MLTATAWLEKRNMGSDIIGYWLKSGRLWSYTHPEPNLFSERAAPASRLKAGRHGGGRRPPEWARQRFLKCWTPFHRTLNLNWIPPRI